MAAKKRKARKNSKQKRSDSLIDLAREQLNDIRKGDAAQDIRSAYQQIWHAGLGAYAQSAETLSDVADAAMESTEGGEKFFKKLVKDGAKLEKKARVELDELRDKAEDRIEKAGKRVSKLESAFDKRVQKAIKRLMIPSKADIDSLETKIDKLQRTLDGKKASSKRKPAAKKKAPTKKRAKKKTTAKKKAPARRKTTARKKAPAKKKAATRR